MTKAPERIWAFPKKDWFNAGASTHRIKTAGAKDVEYVRRDLFDAMQDRAEKAEATIGLKDALIQEERRVRVRAETARDGLRHIVEGLEAERDALRAVNERLREALSKSNDTFSGIAEHILELKPDRNNINWKGIFADCQRGGIAARAALVRKEGTAHDPIERGE